MLPGPAEEVALIEMLRTLSMRMEKASPAQPRPLAPVAVEEISFGWADSSEDEISLSLGWTEGLEGWGLWWKSKVEVSMNDVKKCSAKTKMFIFNFN